MELIALPCIVGFAGAVLFLLREYLPTVAALRWWGYACALGFAVLSLEVLAATEPLVRFAPLILFFALMCGCGQVYGIVRGARCVRGTRPLLIYTPVALGLLVLSGAIAPVLFSGGIEPKLFWMEAARKLVLPVICLILGLHLWAQVSRQTKLSAAFSAVLLLGFGQVFLAKVVPLSSTAWEAIGQWAAALTMTYMAICDARIHDAELRARSERLRTLVDSVTCGICEVDAGGRLAFLNRAASEMLGTGAADLTGVPVHQVLDSADDESSARSLFAFALRPNLAVNQAKAHLRRRDGALVSAEWASSPILRAGKLERSILTLRDTTQRETAHHFIFLRSQVLGMIARNKTLEEVLQLLTMVVEERLAGACCSMLIYEDEGHQVVCGPGVPGALRSAMVDLAGKSATRQVEGSPAGEREAWEGALHGIARTCGLTGIWTWPISSANNQSLGMIVLNRAMPEAPSPEQNQALEEAARLGALAVEHRRSFDRLLRQGLHDPLTGLPNRSLLADRMKQALARAARTHTQVAFICIDLDRFKHINDTYGHETGDALLRQIGIGFASRIRSCDTLARTGGDEFTAVLADVREAHDPERIVRSLLEVLHEPFEVQGHTICAEASIGIALYPQDGKDAESLQRAADLAMYRAKADRGHEKGSITSNLRGTPKPAGLGRSSGTDVR